MIISFRIFRKLVEEKIEWPFHKFQSSQVRTLLVRKTEETGAVCLYFVSRDGEVAKCSY